MSCVKSGLISAVAKELSPTTILPASVTLPSRLMSPVAARLPVMFVFARTLIVPVPLVSKVILSSVLLPCIKLSLISKLSVCNLCQTIEPWSVAGTIFNGPVIVENVAGAFIRTLSSLACAVASAFVVETSVCISKSYCGESVLTPILLLVTSKYNIGVESKVVFLKATSIPCLSRFASNKCPPIRPTCDISSRIHRRL